MQYFIPALALLAAATEAAPAPAAAAASGPFSLMALRSASPLHFQPVNASGGKFWIGKPTSTYCPSPPVDAKTCAATTKDVTALVCNGGSCSMNDIVPGGQQVFVDPKDGSIGYTQAHSASMPAGALTTIFTHKDGYFSTCEGGLVACNDGYGHYAVKVALKGLDVSKCLGFGARELATTAQAWQYA